jgi:hypothetical protein
VGDGVADKYEKLALWLSGRRDRSSSPVEDSGTGRFPQLSPNPIEKKEYHMSRLRRQVRAAVAVMTGLGLPVALPAASASAADPLPTAVTAGGMPTPQRRRFLGRDRRQHHLRRWPLLQGQAGRAAPGGAGEV